MGHESRFEFHPQPHRVNRQPKANKHRLTAEFHLVGTKHRKPRTANRYCANNEEDSKIGRRRSRQGSNQSVLSNYHSHDESYTQLERPHLETRRYVERPNVRLVIAHRAPRKINFVSIDNMPRAGGGTGSTGAYFRLRKHIREMKYAC